ncbi:NFACT RNA binding domain-containing protein [Limosilactobacillus fastidiosus]|uniref:Rqc2 homolog RqcH n=1 Tax=Limosilactobacillus fastidiosus TaxID=2759855 RepID=A0A7W3TZW1_9LACO|nr:NFACT RNA binding domain-containing protein [Limosilactobacillus fastidiosus]MBB1063325.1 NFACT family protein [Limosilactobacillus fastidiosus]MBB1086299.1 NFACT family protein [Limosilactobacillus fastidiosus]MCD7084504.1 NFACT family protein [Limosilactobacillus fastidiosus]MCD7086403.1 NFACT family protein [Limosilactobacillus fastidiosus]MCD7114241.1 NFACT family protein [Limosilactobacillus fastidiosus]
MAFDGFFTHAIVHELNATLATGRVAKVNQPYPAELIMTIRAHRHNYSLLLSTNPTYPRMQITKIDYQNPAVPSNFAMTMRKYLEGAILESIEQVDNDRIIKMNFNTRDELGDRQRLVLITEIMARHSNISLVNEKTGKIIDTIKHVGSDQNRVRLLLPGATFIMPPKQDKVNPYLPNQIYTDLMRENLSEDDLAKRLQHSYQGLGKQSAQELARELQASSDLPTTYHTFLKYFENPDPVIYEDNNGKQQFAAFAPSNIKEEQITHYHTLSVMLDAFYAQKAERDRSRELAGQVLRVLHTELKKDRRKVKKLNQQLADAAKADYYRIRGEILTTYLGKLSHGMTEITLPNFYDDNKPLKINLDPELSPSRNAQKYFTKYDKLKTSVSYVKEQLKLTNDEINYLTNIESQIDLASPADIQEIRLELQQQGYLKLKRQKSKKQRKVRVSKPEEFHTSNGTTVLVGKNNLQNDRLSFKIANKNDIWLHVKDIPGSHVIIRDSNPDDQTLLEAAQLAAYFSKGRDSDNVPVDYLPAKRLHKPNGVKPGFVTFTGQKTLYVTPHKLGD